MEFLKSVFGILVFVIICSKADNAFGSQKTVIAAARIINRQIREVKRAAPSTTHPSVSPNGTLNGTHSPTSGPHTTRPAQSPTPHGTTKHSQTSSTPKNGISSTKTTKSPQQTPNSTAHTTNHLPTVHHATSRPLGGPYSKNENSSEEEESFLDAFMCAPTCLLNMSDTILNNTGKNISNHDDLHEHSMSLLDDVSDPAMLDKFCKLIDCYTNCIRGDVTKKCGTEAMALMDDFNVVAVSWLLDMTDMINTSDNFPPQECKKYAGKSNIKSVNRNHLLKPSRNTRDD